MARLEVHSAALVAVAGQLDAAAGTLSAAAASVPVHPPLAADEVSVSAAARLSAHGAVLSSRAVDGAAVLAAAAAAVRQAVGAYLQTDATNAALVSLRGGGDTPAPVFTPAMTTNAATPQMPISPPAPRDGKSLAALMEAGNASAGSVFATACSTYAAGFGEAARAARAAEASVRAALSGLAGPKLGDALSRFAAWADAMAQHAETVKSTGQGHEDRFSRTQHATPATSEFTNVEQQLAKAQALNSNPATAGMYAPVISRLQTQLLGLHSRTHVAASNYLVGELPQAPPGPPPVTPIVDPAPGTAPAGDQPDPAAANSDQSGDPVKHGRVPGAGPGVGDDPDIDAADALDDPGGGLQETPLSGGAQPLTAMMSMIPGLLGGVVGAAAAIPKALAQQGQSVLSQAVEGVSGLANGLAKPDPDTDVGGAGTGDFGGSAGSGVGGGGSEGGATQPAAGPNLSPSGGTGMMSVAGLPGGSTVAGAGGPPPGLPDAGPGLGGAPMMMPPMGGMGGMGGGAGGGGSRPVKAADKEVLVPPVPNGEPVRGEVLRRRARASVADAPGHSGSQDDVVVTSARSGKRVVLDKDE